MAAWSSMTSGARSALGAGVAAAVILAAYGAWQVFGPQGAEVAPPAEVVEAPEAAPEATTAAPDAAAAPVAEAAPEPQPEAQAEAPAQVIPQFDLVRIAPDGSATVAGTAAPGMKVSMRIDGVEVATTVADGTGQFASLFTLDTSKAPRLLSLYAVDANGAEIGAAGTVAVAPIIAAEPEVPAAPEVADTDLAEAETEVAVAEPEPPAALLLTDEGAVVLQQGTPAVPEAAVSIDTISYTPEGLVQLGGRGAGGGFIRFYLDDAVIAALTVPPNGQWLTTLGDIAPGVYVLRADQLGPDGKVISRFETPFKRETLEALARAASPEAAPVAETPETAPVAETPEAAVVAETPEAAPVAETPEATIVAETPEAAVIAETPEAAPVAAAPEAAVVAETPEAVTTAPEAPAAVAAAVAPATIAAEEPLAEAAAPADPALPAPSEAPAAVEQAAPAIAVGDQPAATPEAEPEAAPALLAAADPAQATAAPAAPAAAAPEAAPAPQPPVTVTVQPGFTLWRIARENFGDGVLYVQVFEANKDKIRDPDLIYPGQVFTLPGSE